MVEQYLFEHKLKSNELGHLHFHELVQVIDQHE